MPRPSSLLAALTGLGISGLLVGWTPGLAADPAPVLGPDSLIVSRSVYQGTAATVAIGQLLPPNCPAATAKCGGPYGLGVPAVADGTYPTVWNNDTIDGSFGVTSPIFLDQLTPTGALISTLPVDPAQLVTSFSSKSELALNRSADGTVLTFMGYVTPVNTLDASNANTPGVVDPTNPVGENVFRAVGQVDASGALQTTETNAYSGNNGRAAALAGGLYYAVGNNNNGSGTPANIITSTGAELIVPGTPPGTPRMIGNFSIAQYGFAPDKPGKDNNFRGLTIFGNTLYVTKGSGGNGINTVYQVGSSGTLPDATTAASAPITILPGLPTTLAKNADAQHPFGIYFADENTLYVADEGSGVAADAATDPNAGLQKWVRDTSSGVWRRVYVLQQGLHLGQPYGVAGYPSALNPAPDGLRNLTGRANPDGTATLWAVTSTVSANGDQGADPNQLVTVTDVVSNTDPALAAAESFTLLRSAGAGEVLRGVSLAPRPKVPGSLQLNGSTSFAEVPNAPELNVAGDWTVEAWFKDDDPAGFNHDFRQILMKGDRALTPDAPYFVLVGRNSILAGVRQGGQDLPIVWSLPFAGLDPASWHHVAVTFRADLGVLNLWLDGRHIAYLSVPAHGSAGNSLPLEIGRNGPQTGKYWLGQIDDVRIWNVARTGGQISSDFRGELAGPQPGLVANWLFDTASGTTALDTAGSHHDATLSGGAAFSAESHP